MASSSTIEIGGEPTSIAAALAEFLRREMSIPDPPASISVEAKWRTSLDGSVAQTSPMFFVPPRSIDWGIDLDGSNAGSLVSSVQDAVAQWRSLENPSVTPGVAVVLRVTLFAADGLHAEFILRYDVA